MQSWVDLGLPKEPPPNAYAVTGDLLPPLLQEVVAAWNLEFPGIPLASNSLIFVIRPDEFYSELELQSKTWLASREMLGIPNFPTVINPLTPDDDWYKRAQEEWKTGNRDAVYILLTSLYHELSHTLRGHDDSKAYREQILLFERFRRKGLLRSRYARQCYASLHDVSQNLARHPERYQRVEVRLHGQIIALRLPVQAPGSHRPVPATE